MSRPDWFVCRNCLFFKYGSYQRIGDRKEITSDDTGNCFYNNLHVLKDHNSFCSNWTCNNCWEGWNDWHWNEKAEKELRIDHNKCEEVDFQ